MDYKPKRITKNIIPTLTHPSTPSNTNLQKLCDKTCMQGPTNVSETLFELAIICHLILNEYSCYFCKHVTLVGVFVDEISVRFYSYE